MVRSPTFAPFSTATDSNCMVVLGEDVIPPLGGENRLIASRALVGPELGRTDIDSLSGDIFPNIIIEFPLDPTGISGASETENDDNWGVGPQGIHASLFWDQGVKGQKVRVGIADSGLDGSHPAFADLIAAGRLKGFAQFDKLGNKELQRTAEGAVVPDDRAKPTFSHWHGTHCASIIAGSPTEGRLRGAAPETDLVVARVLGNSNEGSVAGIYAGLSWLGTQACDIISLSLGWPGLHEEWAAPISELLDAGVVVVTAVGNEFLVPGARRSRSPANYLFDPSNSSQGIILAVGAHDRAGDVWDESGGEVVDWRNEVVKQADGSTRPSVFATVAPTVVPMLIAPGVDIISAVPGGKYRSSPGSSMAAPHIAGLIALTLSAMRNLKPQTRARVAADAVLSALSVEPPNERSGRGRIDVDRLMHRVFEAAEG